MLPPSEPVAAQDNEKDSWMLSYLDILTLLLTLFVVVLAYQLRHGATPASTDHATLDVVPAIQPATPEKLSPPPASVAFMEIAQVASANDVGSLRDKVPAEVTNIASMPPPAGVPPPVDVQPRAATAGTPMATGDSAVAQSAPGESLFALANLDQGIEIRAEQRGVLIELRGDVLFAAGSAALDDVGRAALKSIAASLKPLPNTIWVEGHTDDTPISSTQFASNWELSDTRATAVFRYLVSQGIAAERVRPIGYGDTQPRADNATAAGRQQNRRVALLVEMLDRPPRETGQTQVSMP
jgi:chemotaxis protein MotB